VAPLVNYAQTPQAGERAEQILISILAEEGVRPLTYPQAPRQDLLLQDDRERQIQALDWARQQRLARVDYWATELTHAYRETALALAELRARASRGETIDDLLG
jgi:hypothetical protein